MAEFVEHHKEGMIIEYELMKNCKLFTDEEIRQTKIKRDAFEYKIQSQSPLQKDYLNYIIYERKQLALVKTRTAHNKNQEKATLTNCIVKRIMSLYQKILDRHSDKLEVYDQFMIFCKYADQTSEIPKILDKMLIHHRHSSAAYLKAITYESEDAQNLTRARSYACRSIQEHPKCVELYEVFLKIELDAIAKKLEDKTETENDEEFSLDRPYVIYETVKEKITNVDILIKFLNIATSYSFTKKFQGEIVAHMTQSFAQMPIVWHTIAQRVLHNMVTSNNCMDGDSDLADCIRKCVLVYKTAVGKVATEEMWSLYLDALTDLSQDMSTEPSLKRKSLGHAYKTGYEAGMLSKKYFCKYIEMLMKPKDVNNEYLLKVLESATTKYTNSATLWRLYLKFYVIQENDELVHATFRKITKKLASDAFEIWKDMFAYIDTTQNHQITESFLEEACNQSKKISSFFKPAFLQYLIVAKDITAARKKYREFIKADINCVELHREMARLESFQVEPDLKEWRYCYENMILAKGKSETDIWYEYMRFERDFGEPKLVGMLNNRALVELERPLATNFSSSLVLLN